MSWNTHGTLMKQGELYVKDIGIFFEKWKAGDEAPEGPTLVGLYLSFPHN